MITITLDHSRSWGSMIPGWAFAIIGVGLGIVVHELGHLALALLFRLSPQVISVGIGPLLLRFRIRKLLIELRALPVAGHVLVLRQLRPRRFATMMMTLGGALGNVGLFAAMGAMSALHAAPDRALREIALMQGYLIALNLFPWKDNDGMQLLRGIFQRKPAVLATAHRTLLEGQATKEQIATGPSPAFPQFLHYYIRSIIDDDPWVKLDAIESLRRSLRYLDLAPAERALLLDRLISHDLFELVGSPDLDNLESWSAEALALAPSTGRMVTRGCALVIIGHFREGATMLKSVVHHAMQPSERALCLVCLAEIEEAMGDAAGALHWNEQANVVVNEGRNHDVVGVRQRIKALQSQPRNVSSAA